MYIRTQRALAVEVSEYNVQRCLFLVLFYSIIYKKKGKNEMKKFFSVFFSLILLVVIAAGVYLFAFDKEIPLSLVEDKINEIDPYALKIASFDDVNAMDNFSCNLNFEFRSESDNSRMSFDAKKSGKDDKFVLDLEATSYKYLQGKFYEDESSNGSYFIQNKKFMFRNKGDLVEQSEILWKGEILTSLYLCTPFTKDGLLHADLIKNNKDKITQKGFFITLFASKDDISIELKVSIITKKIKSYTITNTSYNSKNEVESTTTLCYTFK